MKATYNLARLVREGQGQPQDAARAEQLFEKAAQAGFVPAQLTLGLLYDLGQDWPHNPARALAWYRMAAGNGSADANLNLGFLFASGSGVPVDPVEAYARTYAADRLGHPLAAGNLALMREQLVGEQLAQGQARGERYVRQSGSLAGAGGN